jgi:hypothetical protein
MRHEGSPMRPRYQIDRAGATHADEREARIRKIEQISRSLPEDRRNLEP